MVLESRSSRCWQGHTTSKNCRGQFFLASFILLLSDGNPRHWFASRWHHSNLCLHSHSALFSLFASVFTGHVPSWVHACLLSRVWFFAITWTVAHQSPQFTGFSRQEYWGGLPFPPPRDLPDPGTELVSLVSLALEGRFFTTVPPGKPLMTYSFLKRTLIILRP